MVARSLLLGQTFIGQKRNRTLVIQRTVQLLIGGLEQ
jgi:hypothetical protein